MIYLNNKLRDWDGLLSFVEFARHSKSSIVFTNGCFDLIHLGHIECLRKAKSLGDYLIVGVNSDISVKKIKGNLRPILDETQRATIVSSFDFVNCVYVFDEDTPIKIIKSITPDILVKGGDWDSDDVVGADHVLKMGGKVEIIQSGVNISTSNIINDIVNRYSR